MSEERASEFRWLEGRHVSFALRNGVRIDDCQLVAAGRRGADSLWVYVNGCDWFIDLSDVVEIWEAQPSDRRP